jgi:hypothetical protein
MLENINLQKFAEGEQNNATNGVEGNHQGQIEKLEITKEEFDKKLQSEADRRVSDALKTAKQKWQIEYGEKLEAEKKQAEELARLSEEEKQKVLLDKAQKELSIKEKALLKKELKLEAINILADRKMPVSFAEVLIGDDAENTHNNITAFEKEEVNKRLKSSLPREGGQNNQGKLSMNDLIRRKLSK